MLPVGLIYAAIYYGLFRIVIVALDLRTPGREVETDLYDGVSSLQAGRALNSSGAAFIEALGGGGNLLELGACTTRLRLRIERRDRVDEAALKALGSRGVLWLAPDGLQVVLGPVADQVARDIAAVWSPAQPSAASLREEGALRATHPEPIRRALAAEASPLAAGHILLALGGRVNVKALHMAATRLILDVASSDGIDDRALEECGVRAVVKPSATTVHLVVGPYSVELCDCLTRLLA